LQKRVKEQLLLIQEKNNALSNADINIQEMKTVANIKEETNAKSIINNNTVDNDKNNLSNSNKKINLEINKSNVIENINNSETNIICKLNEKSDSEVTFKPGVNKHFSVGVPNNIRTRKSENI